MIVGNLLLVMNGDPYYGLPITCETTHAIFTVQVMSLFNVGAPLQLVVEIESKNPEDTAWSLGGTLATISAAGTYSNEIAGLLQLVRYKYYFTAGASTDGAYVFDPKPQWLND